MESLPSYQLTALLILTNDHQGKTQSDLVGFPEMAEEESEGICLRSPRPPPPAVPPVAPEVGGSPPVAPPCAPAGNSKSPPWRLALSPLVGRSLATGKRERRHYHYIQSILRQNFYNNFQHRFSSSGFKPSEQLAPSHRWRVGSQLTRQHKTRFTINQNF
jgi:hypothetical protein